MKKVVVINKLSTEREYRCCCNIFKKINWYKSLVSAKKLEERLLSEKFNKIAEQGFEFKDEKVLPHHLYVSNEYKETSYHGVYRFSNGDVNKYQVYFGPVIEIDQKLGCGCGSLGCGSLGCSFKTIGCRSKGGNIQYVNFMNDEKNEKVVRKLNDWFGLRKYFNEDMNYVYRSFTFTSVHEMVKEHYNEIYEQYNKDVEEFYNQGLGFIKTIDTPSDEAILTQAMLFGTTGTGKAEMTDLSDYNSNLTLNRFDVWYFPRVKGIIRAIWDFIKNVCLPDFFRKKDDEETIGTSYINDENLEIVKNVYEEDFNRQEDEEDVSEILTQNVVGKIPVTIAVKKKLGFWRRLFGDEEYDFYTYTIDAVEG